LDYLAGCGRRQGLAIFAIWLIVFISAFGGRSIKLPIIGNLAEKQASR